jgi:hypothetical protein
MVILMMKIAGLDVSPGEFRRGSLGHVELPSGAKVNLPVLVMRGTTEGPMCVLIAALHGDEIIGTEVVRRLLWEEIKPDELTGTIVAFPVANPLAFQSGEHVSPQDKCNMDLPDFFDADPKQCTMTPRLASMIGGVLKKANYVLDIHGCGPEPSMCFVYIADHYAKDKKVRDEVFKMAKASGLTLTRAKPEAAPAEGFFGTVLPASGPTRGSLARGVPALTIELKDGVHTTRTVADTGVASIKNILKVIKMLKGNPEKIHGEPKVPGWWVDAGDVRVMHGGLINILKGPGEMICKGELVAKIHDVYGQEVEQVKMPVDGFYTSIIGGWGGRYNAVSTGDTVAIIWEKCPPP